MSETWTDFSIRCQALSELWLESREDEEFKDFIEFNDIGLPLAYAFMYGLAELTKGGIAMVDEAWDSLLQVLGLDDIGFESLDEVIEASKGKKNQ